MIRILILSIILVSVAFPAKWKKKKPTKTQFTLMKSPQALNLQTAEVVPKGDLFYGISHRFNGPLSGGWSEFYGLDGGANMRTKVGYGITDNFMTTLGRSSTNAQLDLNLKYKILMSNKTLPIPIIISANAGLSYTEKPTNPNAKEFFDLSQFFGSLIINTMLFEHLGIGITPTYLHNSLIGAVDAQYSFTLGYYLQFYIGDDMTSFIIEGNPTIAGFRGDGSREYFDTYAFGVELETGGHFFKFLVSNNNLINQGQLHLGSPTALTFENLRFGFQITRNFGT
jgi:hypothetical protein